MRSSQSRLLLAAAAFLAWHGAHAAHPVINEDTGTQGTGGWHLELNAERTRDTVEGVTERARQSAATLSYGPLDSVDLQLTVAHLRVRGGERGALDTALDLKWRFYEEAALSFALKPGLTLPTGDEEAGRGSGEATWGALAIASYQLERWALHGHAGYRRNRNRLGEREALWQLAGALWYNATPALALIVDLSLDRDPDPASGSELRQTVLGVIYGVTKDVDLDAGMRWGNDPAIDRALLFGVTLRWPG